MEIEILSVFDKNLTLYIGSLILLHLLSFVLSSFRILEQLSDIDGFRLIEDNWNIQTVP